MSMIKNFETSVFEYNLLLFFIKQLLLFDSIQELFFRKFKKNISKRKYTNSAAAWLLSLSKFET